MAVRQLVGARIQRREDTRLGCGHDQYPIVAAVLVAGTGAHSSSAGDVTAGSEGVGRAQGCVRCR